MCVFLFGEKMADSTFTGVTGYYADGVTPSLHGRRVIKLDYDYIDESNVIDALTEAMNTHSINETEIEYLWNYYKGNQPVLSRTKTVRPEICNRIVENRANEIVSFKVGYLCGEPIQYIGRHADNKLNDDIMLLNEYMFLEDKASKDQELIEWQMICGTSYRMVLPNPSLGIDDPPFTLHTLDPRNTFVAYSSKFTSHPLFAVKYYTNSDGSSVCSIYTADKYFEVENGELKKNEGHLLGMIPIFEYPANNARLGSFEIVLPLLDAINNIESNRMDGVEQFIQSFIKFVNCDISGADFDEFRAKGAIMVASQNGVHADVDIVSSELDQNQTQTFKDDCYNAVLTICGVPTRSDSGSSDGGSTGSAVMLRNGWSLAEARAKDSENIIKKSEKAMLRLVLKLCRDVRSGSYNNSLDISLRDIELQFTRRNYENIQSKSQTLISMLNCDKVHPLLAFQASGVFVDPERAYEMSMEYYHDNLATDSATSTTVDTDREVVNRNKTVTEKSEIADGGQTQ